MLQAPYERRVLTHNETMPIPNYSTVLSAGAKIELPQPARAVLSTGAQDRIVYRPQGSVSLGILREIGNEAI